MNDILLPYGLRDGTLVHISNPDITSGLTDCSCPECGEQLVARKGDINRHHFSHKGEAGRPMDGRCRGGFETAAHMRAKEIIEAAGEIRFPDGITRRLESVSLEKILIPTALRPDITVAVGQKTAVIEIFITNRCSQVKADLLRSRRIPAMEIILHAWRNAVLDDAAFQKAVLHTASRIWIYDPNEPARRAAAAVLADAQREAAARAEFLAGLPSAHAERIREHNRSHPSNPIVEKQPWVRGEYDQRCCAHPECGEHPSFGYGPPFCEIQTWTCREHQAWFEESQGKARSDQPSSEQHDEWIESVMEPVRRHYAKVTQPRMRAVAEAMRKRMPDQPLEGG